jgi:hypothetical protein
MLISRRISIATGKVTILNAMLYPVGSGAIMKGRWVLFFSLLILSCCAFSGERFTNPLVVFKTGALSFDVPDWIDFTDLDPGQKIETSKAQVFHVANKEGWVSTQGRMVKIFLRKKSDLDAGLLYFTGSELFSGEFSIYKSTAKASNAICTCSDPACQSGIRTTVPDRTYRSNFTDDHANSYSITFIIEGSQLTVTVINDATPSSAIKIIYQQAATWGVDH